MIYSLLLETCDLIQQKMKSSIIVSEKTSKKDLVTNVDTEIEAFLVSRLKEMYPDSKFLGEESDQDIDLDTGSVWVIDPIDGTNNFVRQRKNFGILIARYEDGIGQEGYMVDVLNKKIYHAIKGQGVTLNNEPYTQVYDDDYDNTLISFSPSFLLKLPNPKNIVESSAGIRYTGSCCIDSINVIEKSLGAYGVRIFSPWDVAPMLIFAEELGLVCLHLDGSPKHIKDKLPFIFGQSQIVNKLIEVIG